jgi:hypothetical protein
MTDDLTETTDMTDNDTTTDDTVMNPVDLLPVGNTDVLAEIAEHDDESDEGDLVAEEVEAVHFTTDPSPADDDAEYADSDPAAEGSASDEADAARGGSAADDEPATKNGGDD